MPETIADPLFATVIAGATSPGHERIVSVPEKWAVKLLPSPFKD